MKVNVIRPFLVKGERQEAGSSIELPDALARELIAANKAAPAAPIKAPAGPMTTQTAAAVVSGKVPAHAAAKKE